MEYGHATTLETQEIDHLISQVEKSPTDSALLTRLGAFLFVVCNFPPDQAQSYLYRALAIDPHNVGALFWLAKSWYHDFANSEKAKQYLEQALAIAPHRADCLSLMAATLTDLEADPLIVLPYIDQAVTAAPDWVIPREQRAQLLIKLQNPTKAKEEIFIINTLIANRIAPPKDSIEEYYESAVTGRSVPTISPDLAQYV